MDLKALKKIVSDAYAIAENDTVIPRFSTQFKFIEDEVLIRIPISECQSPPRPLVGLISHIINTALPHLKIEPEDLNQDLLAAAEGKRTQRVELDIFSLATSAPTSKGGIPASIVTECCVLITRKLDGRINNQAGTS